MHAPALNAMNSGFHGSICALVTPFLANRQIDFAALARLIEHQISGGTDALVIAGSTGESVSLDTTEFADLLTASVKIANRRIHVIAGTGTPSTAHSITLGQIAAAAGADGVLVVTPAYCRPTQDGIFQHYQALADASQLPILLYNVPSRTAVDLTPDTVARLSVHPKICGIKEALPDMTRIKALLDHQNEHFVVLSGDDPTAAAAMALGARGLISVAANVAPARLKNLVSAGLRGDHAAAALQTQQLAPLFDALSGEPNPIPVKWAMAYMGLCGPDIRLPLTELRSEYQPALIQALQQVASVLTPATTALAA
jgi:4-hydroxy-tetrahydrodipicolinate synthase